MSEPDLLKQIAEQQTLNIELLVENEKLRNILGLSRKETALQKEDMPKQEGIEKNTTSPLTRTV